MTRREAKIRAWHLTTRFIYRYNYVEMLKEQKEDVLIEMETLATKVAGHLAKMGFKP